MRLDRSVWHVETTGSGSAADPCWHGYCPPPPQTCLFDKLKPQANAASRLGPSTNRRLRLRPSSASLPYPAASGELHGNRVRSADRSGDEVVWRGTPGLARWARAALGAAALASASGLQAAGLFLPAGPASDVAPVAKAAPARRSAATVPDAWERRVRVARHELAAARADVEGAGAGRLLFNVRDGVRLDVAVERTAPTLWGYSLSGRVVGDSGGFATLVVHEEAVAASIWTPSASYELLPLGRGTHALRDVTNMRLECRMPQTEPNVSAAVARGAATRHGGADPTVVDILVVYTPAAEERVSGWTASPDAARDWIEAFNDLAVAETNDAFERSGAFVSLNLLGIEKVDYEPETVQEDSGVLRSEDVEALRDRLGADLVHATVGCCFGASGTDGLSFLTAGSSSNFVAHEVGHNFEILHERHEFRGSQGARGYRHGFTTEGCDSTIMSYHAECLWRGRTQPFYASPWRYSPRNGGALGVARFSKARGARGPADAVLTLNRNRHRVADLRPSRNGE